MVSLEDAYPSALTTPSAKIDRLNYDLRAAKIGLRTVHDETVRRIDCLHTLQFLNGHERIAVWNEWYRVLEPGGRVQVVVPHYSHASAFAHPLTQWPPFNEFSFYFLDKSWRDESPSRSVEGLSCDFVIDSLKTDADAAYSLRTQEWIEEATRWFWNVGVQINVWLAKR